MAIKRRTPDPLPVSGERVMMPKERSRFNKEATISPSERSQIGAATRARRSWEATPEGQSRTRQLGTVQGAGPGMQYFINRSDEPEVTGAPRHYDVQLPGMADPNAAPRPPRWEELSNEQQSHAVKALRMRGTSIETMTSDMGAHLDQAHQRAWDNDAPHPWSQNFYERGAKQRDRVDESARMLGVPATTHAQSNAFTSPNTKFEIRKADGTTAYPNDEAAIHATRWVQQGGDPDKITNELSTTGTGEKRAQGYVTNIRKAAKAVQQHLAGVSPADMRLGDGDKSPFDTSPKTGPYANSWNDSHPQFTVADVHTGGGGGFPHLSSEKAVLTDEHGQPKMNAAGTKEVRGKSERERALESVPFAHSAVDYAMRQAMQARNLPSTRQAQAAQWGEEQLQRGEGGLRGAPRERHVYPGPDSSFHQIEGQGQLGFTQDARHANHLAEMRHIARHAEAKIPGEGEPDHRSPTARKLGLPF